MNGQVRSDLRVERNLGRRGWRLIRSGIGTPPTGTHETWWWSLRDLREALPAMVS